MAVAHDLAVAECIHLSWEASFNSGRKLEEKTWASFIWVPPMLCGMLEKKVTICRLMRGTAAVWGQKPALAEYYFQIPSKVFQFYHRTPDISVSLSDIIWISAHAFVFYNFFYPGSKNPSLTKHGWKARKIIVFVLSVRRVGCEPWFYNSLRCGPFK